MPSVSPLFSSPSFAGQPSRVTAGAVVPGPTATTCAETFAELFAALPSAATLVTGQHPDVAGCVAVDAGPVGEASVTPPPSMLEQTSDTASAIDLPGTDAGTGAVRPAPVPPAPITPDLLPGYPEAGPPPTGRHAAAGDGNPLPSAMPAPPPAEPPVVAASAPGLDKEARARDDDDAATDDAVATPPMPAPIPAAPSPTPSPLMPAAASPAAAPPGDPASPDHQGFASLGTGAVPVPPGPPAVTVPADEGTATAPNPSAIGAPSATPTPPATEPPARPSRARTAAARSPDRMATPAVAGAHDPALRPVASGDPAHAAFNRGDAPPPVTERARPTVADTQASPPTTKSMDAAAAAVPATIDGPASARAVAPPAGPTPAPATPGSTVPVVPAPPTQTQTPAPAPAPAQQAIVPASTLSQTQIQASPTPAPPPPPASPRVQGPARDVFAAAVERSRRDEGVGAPLAMIPASPAPVVPPPAAQPLETAPAPRAAEMIAHVARLMDEAAMTTGEARVRLAPDALGPVELAVRTDGDRVHVRLQADASEARQQLRDAAPRLAEAAEARGLRLGETTIGGSGSSWAGGSGAAPDRGAAHDRRPLPSRRAGADAPAAERSDSRLA